LVGTRKRAYFSSRQGSPREPRRCLTILSVLGCLLALGCAGPEPGTEKGSGPTAAETTDVQILTNGQFSELRLEGGSTFRREFSSEPGTVQRLVVDARGNDVVVKVLDVSGRILRETEGNGRTWGLETISFADDRKAEQSGEPLVAVFVIQRAGSDSVRVESRSTKLLPANASKVVAAEQLLATARRERGATTDADKAAGDSATRSSEGFATIDDSFGETIAALEVGSVCIESQDSACLLEWGNTALRRARRLRESRLIDQALTVLGAGEAFRRKSSSESLDTAQTYLEEVTSKGESTTSVRHLARAHILLCIVHWRRSDPDSSQLKYLAAERARDLFRQSGDHVGEAEANSTLGGFSRRIGDVAATMRHYAKVEAALGYPADDPRSLATHPRALANLFNNLGVYYRSRGNHQKALETYNRSVEVLEATGFGPRTEIYSNMGRLTVILGDPERAMAYHEKVLPDQPALAAVDIGHCLRELGRHQEALDSFRRSLELNRGSKKLRAWALDGEAKTLMVLGSFAEAESRLVEALEIYEVLDWPLSQAITLRSLADVRSKLGRLATARKNLTKASEIVTDLGDDYHLARIDTLLGAIEHSEQNYATALECFDRATELLEELRSDLGDVDQRANFFAARQEHYLNFIALLADLDQLEPNGGYARRAFQVSEQSRARSLLDVLRMSRSDETTGLVPERIAQLVDDLGATDLTLEHLQSAIVSAVTDDTPDRSLLMDLRSQVDTTQAARRAIWDEIRRLDPKYAELRSPRPIGLERIQSVLDSSTALLQYALGEEDSYLLVVTGEDVKLFVLDGKTRGSIQRLSARLRRDTVEKIGNPTAVKRAARSLYNAVLTPAEKFLEPYDRWVVVPDGPLYSAPFEALIRDTDDGAEYLVERTSIHYAPSAATLVTLHEPSTSAVNVGHLVAFADSIPETRPLRGALEEVAEIKRILEAEGVFVDVRTGPEASKSFLKQSKEVRSARWIHLATHGDFDATDSESSGLFLAPTKGVDDGLLTSGEVLELDLTADLVVLSGCETGLGKELRGEGIIGLTRAFMHAGAQSVVMSLWKVEDRSTSRLMVSFYDALRRGHTKADALREAKIELLQTTEWSHPYFWAPFVLVGPSDSPALQAAQ